MGDLLRWSVREALVSSKTSLNRPTFGPALKGPFREVGGLGSKYIINLVSIQATIPISVVTSTITRGL